MFTHRPGPLCCGTSTIRCHALPCLAVVALPGNDVAVKIDNTSPDWPYQQLAAQLKERIAAGDLGPKLPSIMKLAEEAEVSTRTMQRAINLLKREQVVHTVVGRGIFVTRPRTTT